MRWNEKGKTGRIEEEGLVLSEVALLSGGQG